MNRIRWGPTLRKLGALYAEGTWKVPVLRERGADPFLVLVSTVISHRTRDEVTRRTALRLYETYPTPTALARAKVDAIKLVIREVGLAAEKAAALQEASRIIVQRFGGRVPDSEAELRTLPRVGKKTAAAVMVFGYRKDAIPVDTHIHRVANRLGVVRTAGLEETSEGLRAVVPRRYWAVINPILVQHGQNICTANHPKCDSCPIRAECPRTGVR